MTIVAVVDDDLAILDALRTLVECRGWAAITCSSVDDFLSQFDTIDQLDCVVLDPHLGEPNGDQIASKLRERRVPFIGLTARPDSPVSKQVAALGAYTMMTKPASSDDLLFNIQQACSTECQSNALRSF